jgi:hypothetical protein
MALGRNFRLRLAWLAAVALAVGPLALTPAAHAAAAAADDQGIQDTGGFGFYDVMANDGTDGSQSVSLPGNTDADVTTDGSSISVDLSADVSPFVGTKTITYELDDIDLNPIGQATLTVKVVDPSGVQITAGNGQATVSWPGLPNGITGMRITSSTSPIFDHSTGTTITSAGTGPHDVTGLTNGTTYFFYVTAMFAGQDDPSGATGSAAPRAAANHAPVAVADTVSLVDPNPKQLSPTGNDTDADGDLLVITGHSAPAHGTVTCGSDSCEYTPDAAPVDDTFTYSIADGFGGTDTGTVTLVARHVTANPDPVSTFVDESTSVDVLANDTFLLAGDSPNLGAVPAGVDAFVEADGTVAVSGLTQGPYQIPYDVLDTDGDILASSHLSVTVGAKRPLVAFHDDATTDLDLATDISVGQNDAIQVPGGFPLNNAGTKVTVNPTHGTATLSFAPEPYFGHNFELDGALQNLPVIHYVPNAHFTGDDTLTYQLQDAQGRTDAATVAIHVAVPDATSLDAVPTTGQADLTWTVSPSPAVDDVRLCYTLGNDRTTVPDAAGSATTCTHEVTLPPGVPTADTMSGLTNDVWYTATVFVHSNDGAAGLWSPGLSTSFRPGVGAVTNLDGDGGPTNLQVTWTNPTGPRVSTGTTVRYSTSAFPTTPADGTGGTNVGAGVTQASVPSLTAGTYFVSVFSTNTLTFGDPRHITLTLAANNHAPVAVADVVPLDENTSADVSVLGNDTDADVADLHDVRSYTQPAHGSVTCSGDAANAVPWSCGYLPNQNFSGDDSFTYVVTDHRFGASTGTVTLHVAQVNTAPQASDDAVVATKGHATPIDLTPDAFDPEGDSLTYAVVTPPAHASAFSCTSAGACTYTGNALGSDSFTWHVTDNGVNPNNLVSLTATMSITVVANQPPSVVDKNASVSAGASVPVNVAAGATDPDGDPMTFSVFTQAQKGTASCNGAGACTYTANPNATGLDSFTFQADDGHGGTSTGSVLITISHANHPPVVVNDTVSTSENNPVTIGVGTNDSDPDGDPLTFARTTGPAHGTAICTAAGSCTYSPARDYVGADSFTYTASDGSGGHTVGTVSVTVQAVQTAGSVSATRGGPAVRSVLSPLTVTGSAVPARAGAGVTLQRLNGATWSTVASTTESAAGAYSFSVKQATGAFSYRVVVAGSASVTAATSATLTAAFYQVSMPAGSTKGDEYVTVKNTGTVAVNLRGWTITTKGGKVLKLPSYALKAGKSVKVHTRKGSSNSTNLYLNKPNSFAKHDTLTLKDAVKVAVAKRKL